MKSIKPLLSWGVTLLVVATVVQVLVPAAGFEVLDGNVLHREQLGLPEHILSAIRLLVQFLGAALVGASLLMLPASRKRKSPKND